MLESALLAVLIVVVENPQPEWIAPTAPDDPGPAPSWVWVQTPDQPAPPPTTDNAPAGTVYLTRTFDVPRGVRAARLALAVDNSASAWLNGREVLRADSWSAVRFAEVALAEGANVLAIEATNGKSEAKAGERSVNPAGIIARLTIELDDGTTRWIVTDKEWTGASSEWVGFPKKPPPGAAAPVVVLGSVDSRPWGLRAGAFMPPAPCPMLRRSFTLDERPNEATVEIIGLGHYELTCNGQPVGHTLVNQSWSQYDKTLYSQRFDLVPNLRAGENVIGVTLGNSFWSVRPTNDANRFSKTDAMPDFSNGEPYLLWLDARFQTPRGEQRIVSEAENWKWADSPLTFSHVYGGEDYDARLIQPGWNMPGFDDSKWRPVQAVGAPRGERVPLTGPGMRAFEVFTPTEIKEPVPGVYTYIFPQNCSALLRFTLAGGKAGERVRFKPCEYIDDAGRVKFTYTWNTGKDIWHDYIKRGDGEEMHQTLFCFVGAQFVGVEGAVPEGRANPDGLPVLRSLEQVHVRADCPTIGSFSCTSPMHAAAHKLIDWSIRSNMAHFPMDCPHREKNSWLEQDWHMARALSYTYDVNAWLGKLCHDIRDTQLPDGHIPTNSPNYLVGVPPHGFWNEAAEWGVAGVLVPWHLYEWYGDSRILEESYDSARRYIDYLASTSKDGIITSNLGDWYDFGHGKGNGPSRWTPNEVSATVIWAIGADTLARMAGILQRTDDAAKYRAMHTQIRADFQRRFYDASAKTVRHNGSCQAGTASALYAGLIPEPDRAAALNAICDDLEKRNFQQTAGEVLQVFFIRVLAENGRGDLLHRVYNREEVGSYGHMVRSGLTTLPESWDAKRGTGDSLTHFMLGHLMEWHYAYVAGIRQQPVSIGWKKIIIAPQPPSRAITSSNAIHSTEVRFNSPRGLISSQWSIRDGVFRLSCDVPEGVEAEAVLPDGTRHPIKDGSGSFESAW